MVHMDVEAEIAELKRRLVVLENEVQADHDFAVKAFMHVRQMRDDIALLRAHAVVNDKRIERLEERMERVETDIAALRSDLKGMRGELDSFRKELPAMISDTMREVLREFRR
jgi:chromosome segregation ATPase